MLRFSMLSYGTSLGGLFVFCCTLAATAHAQNRDLETARNRMVDEEIVDAGVKDERVIESMRSTLRHEFMPFSSRRLAYYDMAVPIGDGQTISPPFVVAFMTESLDPKPTDKVLEIGTGSGYQAAVLSPLVKDVYTIEIVENLGRRAAQTLKKLKYENVHTKIGDGYQGWPEHAPFDKIIVTCSPEDVPQPLVDQLREGGQMVVPLGQRYQQTLYLLRKKDGKLVEEALRPTLFVPMTGKAEDERDVLPNPEKPEVVNGSFEEQRDDELPLAWHYIRRGELVEDKLAPQGTHILTFKNDVPGRDSKALQAFAVDGRKVQLLAVRVAVKADNVQRGRTLDQRPAVHVTYYDEKHGPAGEDWIGPWFGSFDWQRIEGTLRVPIKARAAIIRIGLLGGTGEVSFDDLEVKAAEKK